MGTKAKILKLIEEKIEYFQTHDKWRSASKIREFQELKEKIKKM